MPSNRNNIRFLTKTKEVEATCPAESAQKIIAAMKAMREGEGLGNEGTQAAIDYADSQLTLCSKSDVQAD